MPTLQVVPQGIESVNGSDINMGCASPLVNRSGVMHMVCDNSESYLIDGCSPAIDTSTSNWASQLVTLRKVSDHAQLHFDHVSLTFGFNTAVSLTAIELDLFLCPEWNIGAPNITVAGSDLLGSSVLATGYTPSQSSCDSLSTVSIPLQGDSSYPTWHILVTFPSPHEDIQWVHVGEVRFLNESVYGHPSSRHTSEPTSGKIYTFGQACLEIFCTVYTALGTDRYCCRSEYSPPPSVNNVPQSLKRDTMLGDIH